MEQGKTNIAALLKDAPKGTKFYSTVCGECEFDGITQLGYISTLYDNSENCWDFDKYGYSCDDTDHKGECLLFPSREVRDWGCFRAKYVYGYGKNDAEERRIQNILKSTYGCIETTVYKHYPDDIRYIDTVDHCLKVAATGYDDAKRDYILSTGTELKLAEEQPKFKVGDVVKVDSGIFSNVIGAVESTKHCGYKNDRFKLWVVDGGKAGSIDIPIEDTSHLATPEEITKWNKEVLEPNRLHYSKSKRKIIHWFLPFDRTVERCKDDDEVGEWTVGIFSHYSKENTCYPYRTLCGFANECLPYNERTAKLIGTTDDYEEK